MSPSVAGDVQPQACPWLSPKSSASRPAKKVAAPAQSNRSSIRSGASATMCRALRNSAAAPTGTLM